MKKRFLPLLLFAALNVCAQHRMTTEMLWSLKRVSGEGLNTSGTELYYAAKTYDVSTEKSSTKHYTINLKTDRLFIRNEDKSIFQRDANMWYAADEKGIYKSVNEGKTWQFLYSPVDGADNFRVSPDGKYLAYTKDILVKKMLAKDIYPEFQKSTAQIYTDLMYRHWDQWEDGKFSHLFIVPIKDGYAKDLMIGEPYDVPQKPFGGTEDLVWSPDSKGIIYVCKKKFGKEYALSTNADLYYYDIKRDETINLTANMNGYDMNPQFSNDGKYLAWTSMKHDGYEADKNDIYVMDMKHKSAHKRNITQDWDGTVDAITWSKDNHIYFTAAWRGTEQVFETDGNIENETLSRPKKLTDGKFDVNSFIGETGNDLIVSRCDMNHATELYAVDKHTGDMKQLTHENDKTYNSINLSKTELKMIQTKDHHQMGVWVIYPPDFNPAKKYPTLLYCQGGPQSALSQFYSFRWNFQLMAANGYIVVAPNRRGMPGWGVKWNEAISKDWGGEPMQDYLDAIDALSDEPYVDRTRLGCVGASYGGYSVYMLAGIHQNRFKTFIAHDGLFDLKSWYGTTEELWFANYDIGGPYWKKPEPISYEKFNPSNYIANWNTPIMIIQGGIDYRVPVEQGLEAFQAAQLKGIKSKLLYCPNENHWILHTQNAIVWQKEFYKWLSETL